MVIMMKGFSSSKCTILRLRGTGSETAKEQEEEMALDMV